MSRSLPDHPNFEHLRKQAKDLLRSRPGDKLADAQRALAREYGFPTWAALKAEVQARTLPPIQQLKAAICGNGCDAAWVRAVLQRHPELRAQIDDPLPGYGPGQHALFAAVQRGSRDAIDALLEAGADIDKRTEGDGGGFGVLDDCDPSLADFLIARGARMDAHAAARLGRVNGLRALIAADASLVQARGGGGQTPLHCAATVEVAELLLDHGADIDALDTQRQSTPAQHMLRAEHKRHYPRDRQDIARYLAARGCRADLPMAAALGDLDLARRLLGRDPECVRTRVSGRTAHAIARDFGHEEVFELLLSRTPDDLKHALACELGDATLLRAYLAENPTAPAAQARKLPDAAQGNNTAAVRLMLEAGWPVDAPGELGGTALHWAGYNGNAAMTRAILRFHPTLEQQAIQQPGTALGWALFGSGNGPRRDTGDYAGVVQALLAAGAIVPPDPERLEPSDAVLDAGVAPFARWAKSARGGREIPQGGPPPASDEARPRQGWGPGGRTAGGSSTPCRA